MNIFLVDDELLVRTGIQTLIPTDQDYTLAGDARTGEEALEILPHLGNTILITDIVMPGMSGLELIRKVREARLPVQVIILTSHREFDYARQAMEMGAVDYLLKHELNSQDLQRVLDKARSLFPDALRKAVPGPVFSSRPEGAGKIIIRIGDYHTISSTRDPGEFSTGLIHLVTQIAGKAIGLKLEQAQSGVWIFSWTLNHPHPLDTLQGRRQFGQRLATQLFAIMNVRTRIGLSPPDGPPDSEFFDRAFAFPEPVVLWEDYTYWVEEEKQGVQKGIDHSGSDFIAKSLIRLQHYYSAGNWHHFQEELSAHFELFKKVHPGRNTVIQWAKKVMSLYPGEIPAAILYRIEDSLDMDELSAILAAGEQGFILQSGFQGLPPEIQRVQVFIEKNFQQTISLEQAAEVAAKSPSYFSDLFHRTMGIGFVDYINHRRIQHAQVLLTQYGDTGDLPIRDIAPLCGFQNEKYFSRLFKRITGQTPGEYRSKNRAPLN